MKKRFLFMLFFLFFLMGIAWSQTGTVKGTVTSGEDGLPVVGASVLVKGTTIGTITDVDGRFSIQNLPASAPTIVVSFVGMKSQELPVSQEEMEIVLNPDAETLDEVVVTAQGLSRKEKSLGYSTQKVGGEQLTTVRQTDLGNAMAGKIAGARFYGSSGSTFDSGSIVLRGTNSFTSPQGSEPIYVVDGSITNKNSVNMDDVESINVLKGSAATALYGSEGGNGAVIITTKRAQEGKGRIEVSHTLQWERYYNHFDMQKQYGGGSLGYNGEVLDAQYGEEYDTMSAQYLYGIFRNQQNEDGSYYYDYHSDESWGARFDPRVQMASALYWDPTSTKYRKADAWVSQLDLGDLFRTALTNTTNLSFSKAGKDYSSRISYTHTKREGIQQNSGAERQFLAVKTSFHPIEWMNVSLDYKFTYRRNHNAASEDFGDGRNVLHKYIQWGQTSVNLNDYKDYLRPDGTWRTWNIKSITNLAPNFHDSPYAVLDNINFYETSRWNVFTADAEFLLPKHFKAGVRVTGNLVSYNEEQELAAGGADFLSYYGQEQYHASDMTVQGRVTWGDRYLNDRLSLDAAAFVEQRMYNYGSLQGNTTDGLIINKFYNLAASSGYVNASNEDRHYKTRSVFATVTAGFDDTYFLDGSLRNDWDSRLPSTHNSYLYGGLSASVMLNRFVKNLSWLNYWKLRSSLAQVGSTLSVYKTIPSFETDKYNSLTAMYAPYVQLNPNIKPTISTSYEVGTEFRLFQNRFWGDLNFYVRDTRNQILNVTVAPQSGYSSRQLNAGLVRNKGIEISLGGIPVRTKDFQWDVDFNIAKNDNKLVRLNDEINEYLLEGNRFYYFWYLKAKVGSPIGVITTMSRFKRNEQGELLLKPTSSAGWGGGYSPALETDVEKEVGNFQPDWTGGFSTSVRYKEFRLAASFDFMIGGQMVSWTNLWSTGSGTSIATARLNNRGVNEREGINRGGGVYVTGVDETTGEKVSTYMNAYNYYHYQAYYDNDYWVYDRSYLKLRELSLSYQVPASALQKLRIGLNDASVSFVASNPWLIYSACPNLDPSESGSNWLEQGQAASTRSFGLTVKLGF